VLAALTWLQPSAEGFGRFSPGQFAHILDISRASALETKTLLKKGLAVGYWAEAEFRRLDDLATRGLQTIAKLQRYLRSPAAKRNAERHRHRRAGGTLRTIRTMRTI
jgi:hypothetical protein